MIIYHVQVNLRVRVYDIVFWFPIYPIYIAEDEPREQHQKKWEQAKSCRFWDEMSGHIKQLQIYIQNLQC